MTKTYQTQIEKLKEKGLYGSTADPMWNPETRRHDCCGATRSYYHHKDCPVATRDILGEKAPKLNQKMKWSNLLQNKCPGCNRDLVKTMVQTDDDSIACKCGFKCAKAKYEKICMERVSSEIDDSYEDEEEPSLL